jgi:predicted nucleotidyltransferase
MPVEDDGVRVLHVGVMVSMSEIQRYCDEIAAAFKPRRIILFGSHAYGRPNEDSDVDVLVVMPRLSRSRHEIATGIRQKVDSDFPVDVLVRGEAEVERKVRQKDMFMTHITREGRVMYEALHA